MDRGLCVEASFGQQSTDRQPAVGRVVERDFHGRLGGQIQRQVGHHALADMGRIGASRIASFDHRHLDTGLTVFLRGKGSGANGRQRVAASFRGPVIWQALEEVYRELAPVTAGPEGSRD